jgi:hypothetical protein
MMMLMMTLRETAAAAAARTITKITTRTTIKFFIYLRTELNSQWPIIKKAGIHKTTAMTTRDKTNKKQKGNNKTKKNG